MKFQILKHRPPHFFIQQIHHNPPDTRLESVKPEFELSKAKGVLESILRWEEDGGKIFEFNHFSMYAKGETQ